MPKQATATGWICIGAALAMIFAGAVGVSRADDASDAKQAAQDFVAAVTKGDSAAAKACLTDTQAGGDTGKFVAAWSDASAAHNRYVAAANARFGKDKPEDEEAPTEHFAHAVDSVTFTVTGNHATASRGNSKNTLDLEKTGGVWKVSHLPFESAIEEGITTWSAWARAADQTAKEIADGKYATRNDAVTAYHKRFNELRDLTSASKPAP